MYDMIINNVHKQTPLVHCITNAVTMNDCANILLACGASPIMADDIREVEEITAICSALYLNIGTLNSQTVDAMMLAGKKSNELGHPIVFDPVGAGASSLRTSVTLELIENVKCSVIRGNVSEIKSITKGVGAATKGVDVGQEDIVTENEIADTVILAQDLSKRTGAVIAVTGEIDIVADSQSAYTIRNGHVLMKKVTGTGCMLTAIIAAFCGANPNQLLNATATAVCAMDICGELAYKKMLDNCAGTSSFRNYIIDEMSNISPSTLSKYAKLANE